MKVRGKERVAFNFIGLAKSFFGDNSNIIEDEDSQIEKEVNEIRKQQNNDFIKKLESSMQHIEKTKSEKTNNKINVKTTINKDSNAVENSKRKEELERE